MNLQQARSNMIEQQVRPWDVLDQRVLDVLDELPRDAFVPAEHQRLAYTDYELPIGHGQFMMKPVLEGRLLQALEITTTDSVLEIGAGSGYVTACLSRLAQHVDALEIHPELAASATGRLAELAITNATILEQDATEIWDAKDAYNAILFGASVPVIPEWYEKKLAIGGRLLAVVGNLDHPTMEAKRVIRVSENEWLTESLFETTLPPLAGYQDTTGSAAFVF